MKTNNSYYDSALGSALSFEQDNAMNEPLENTPSVRSVPSTQRIPKKQSTQRNSGVQNTPGTQRIPKTYRIPAEYVDMLDRIAYWRRRQVQDIATEAIAEYIRRADETDLAEKP